ncbi:MAG TPA: DUF5668 domain-containing protein [bacterium]
MKSTRRPDRLFGWLLLLLGALLLLDHWYPHLFGWTTILIALGAALLIRAARTDRGAAFPGAFLLLLGLFFLVKETDLIYIPWWHNWPMILLILGISFVVLFAFDTTKRGALMVGIPLIVMAFIFLSSPYRWEDILDWIGDWWPLILILIGLNILWKASLSKKSN